MTDLELYDLSLYMRRSVRDELHAALAPCSAERFWLAYRSATSDKHCDELLKLVKEEGCG
jgi:hypothetical protein